MSNDEVFAKEAFDRWPAVIKEDFHQRLVPMCERIVEIADKSVLDFPCMMIDTVPDENMKPVLLAELRRLAIEAVDKMIVEGMDRVKEEK